MPLILIALLVWLVAPSAQRQPVPRAEVVYAVPQPVVVVREPVPVEIMAKPLRWPNDGGIIHCPSFEGAWDDLERSPSTEPHRRPRRPR